MFVIISNSATTMPDSLLNDRGHFNTAGLAPNSVGAVGYPYSSSVKREHKAGIRERCASSLGLEANAVRRPACVGLVAWGVHG